MKSRYRLVRRNARGGKFYLVDNVTGLRESLNTTDAEAANQILQARLQSIKQPQINLQIARAYLAATDEAVTTRTWQDVMDEMGKHKHGPTLERWKRYGNNFDYGFPNKETGISYFEEKVCQFGIPQGIRKWNRENAIEMFKERYKRTTDTEKYHEELEEMRRLEEYDEVKFYEMVREFDCDYWEYRWESYTDQFEFMFRILQSVSDQIWDAVKREDKGDLKVENR